LILKIIVFDTYIEMDMNGDTEIDNNYTCITCDITCSRESEWARHIITRKHKNHTNGSILDINGDNGNGQIKCGNCNKIYVTSGGLWKHHKKCKPNESLVEHVVTTPPEDVKTLTTLVMEMMKNSNDLQKQMLDICKNNSNTMINSHNNSHNKTFNLQFFLNEQCKDAMNMSEFVESFELELSDLESVGELGYVDGMTKIFIDKLNSMDVYKRPMHCSDGKREIIYIKDEDRWEREKPSNPKLRKAVRNVSFKNMKLTNLWSDTYPDSKSSESNLNDVYMRLVLQSTGGSGEISASEDKIIKRIAKGIVIDKHSF
jgi:hypothetical protein